MLARSRGLRGAGWIGWFMLVPSPFMALEAAGVIAIDPPEGPLPNWPLVGVFTLAAAVGALFVFGRAGTAIDTLRGEVRVWWGLTRWPWHVRREPLSGFHTVRLQPRVVPSGTAAVQVWAVLLVRGRGESGDRDEVVVHQCSRRADAEALAAAVARVTRLSVQVVESIRRAK